MPWIKQEERQELKDKFKSMTKVTVGQATYLFYKRFLELWTKEQRYKTIHFVGLLRERPELDPKTWDLTSQLQFKNLTKSEITQSRSDAHLCMWQKYFLAYEESKLNETGEVEIGE